MRWCLKEGQLSVDQARMGRKGVMENHPNTTNKKDRSNKGKEKEMKRTSRKQLKAMLRKNWLLKIRHPFVTLMEVSPLN